MHSMYVDVYAPAHGGAERPPVRVEERAHAAGGGVTAAAGSVVAEPCVQAAQYAGAANECVPIYLVNPTQPMQIMNALPQVMI